jgi:beta-glucosidase
VRTFRLPEQFGIGSATAATQIEGGDTHHNWNDWCQKGKIKDGASCSRANDHWNRYEEDIGLMKRLNHGVYRMGLEWSRIEPQKGVFDDSAMEHYRSEIRLLLDSGIKPLVTLHHFSHPMWFVREGEFESASCVRSFERYVRYVVGKLGDLVEEYITINEPNVFMANGYFFGDWPPGKKDFRLAMRVMKNMTLCHIAAYKAIHEIRSERGFPGRTMVGVANHLRVFDPISKNPLDYLTARLMQYLFQDAIIKSMTGGFLVPPIGLGAPAGRGRYYDFIGINYYTRTGVHFNHFEDATIPGNPRNDLGWEIYPEGLTRLCRYYYKKYRAPIWITENGTCDDKDAFRTKYLYDHLNEIAKLCEEGIPVERYYHWTLMDNFEWIEGESARFGLIRVDYETQKRTIRKSGEFFAEFCKEKGVTQQMLEKYFGN